MKKILILSLTAAALFAQPSLLIKGVEKGLHPLPIESLSQESGGTLTAEQAYSDGVGVIMIDPVGTETTDYSTLNDLVLKYGSAATAAGLSLRDYVLTTGSAEDKAKAELLAAAFVEPDLSGVLTLYNGTLYCNGATPGTTLVEGIDVPDVDGDGVNDIYYVAIGVADIKTKITSGLPANNICTSKVTNLSWLFSKNTAFNQDISKWDTGNVTTMARMFYYASSFNQNISNWNTSKVTDMSYMFSYASKFNNGEQSLNFDTGNVTNMDNMFSAAKNFNQPLNFKTANVLKMPSMFYGASAFNQDISNWCVSDILSRPTYFDTSSGFVGQTALQPQWGTCPTL